MPANLENSVVAPGLEKFVFIPIPKKGNAKECSNYRTIALISVQFSSAQSLSCVRLFATPHTSKVMLKILQARLQQYMNREIPDVQAEFRQGRRAGNQIANIRWITEKEENFRKASTSVSWTTLKPLTVWIRTDCGKF